MKALIVVDMQNDFVDGSLGWNINPEKHLAALETMRSCQINVL